MKKRIVTRTTARELHDNELGEVAGGTTQRTYYSTNVGPGGDRDYTFDFDRDSPGFESPSGVGW